MKKLAIIGSGELGRQIKHIAAIQGKYAFAGYFDDFADSDSPELLGRLEDISTNFKKGKFELLFLAIGYKHLQKRKELFEDLKGSFEFASIIHPNAYIDPTASVFPGCAVYPGTVIDKDSIIRENVLLNNAVVISHNCDIGAHSFIAPAVSLAGYCTIGESVFLGIGTTIIDNLTISAHISTGGGTVVIKDLTSPGVYVGNPARLIK